jgi:hypothetical protein
MFRVKLTVNTGNQRRIVISWLHQEIWHITMLAFIFTHEICVEVFVLPKNYVLKAIFSLTLEICSF